MIYLSLSKDLSYILLRLSQDKKEAPFLSFSADMPIPACFSKSGRANFLESDHELG